jgi:hypothetical protein
LLTLPGRVLPSQFNYLLTNVEDALQKENVLKEREENYTYFHLLRSQEDIDENNAHYFLTPSLDSLADVPLEDEEEGEDIVCVPSGSS